MDILTRQQALAQGLTHYFTGKACKRGHHSVRYAKTGNCCECTITIFNKRPYNPTEEQQERYRQRNRDYARARRLQMTAEEKKAQTKQRKTYINQYINERRESDPSFKLRMNLRHRVWCALKSAEATKNGGTMDLTGCTVEELRHHLEAQFADGMSWENYGRNGWHVDHIRPCASFDLTDPEQQRQCFHYTNLQPLWAADNIRKGDKRQPPKAR
jgi:hypothetical protein